MKFAFLVHPLSDEAKALVQMNEDNTLVGHWGGDILEFCTFLHQTMAERRHAQTAGVEPRARVIDVFANLRSDTGAVTEGRLYEIPMGAVEILDDPARAIDYIEQAIQMAAEWGAGVVGLGSMTGVVGGQGTFVAERSPVPVTTGNSLTIHAALQNLYYACLEANVDPSKETVAVVGIPGSIAAAAAKLLAPIVGELLLVARRDSPKARKLSEELDAELLFEIPSALQRAKIILSATSTGSCIDQALLQPGAVVIDVGVPADVQGGSAIRDDVLIISGGLSLVPDGFPRDSMFLGFHHGMVPSCLGETMNLALENRGECFSLGRDLSTDKVKQIGAIADRHGFKFDRLYSFGLALEPSQLAQYHKAVSRRTLFVPAANGYHETDAERLGNGRAALNGSRPAATPPTRIPTSEDIGDRAAKLYERYINPVLLAIGGKSGFVKTFIRAEGCHLWDHDENRYLDLVAGFGSVNLGHNHPRIVEELTQAMRLQAPGFAQSAVNPLAARLAEELIAVAPPSLEMVFFCNSGTESVEAALKLARLSTGRSGLLHCQGSYHGKSLGALSVTGNASYQKPFGPLLPDCTSIPYADLEALERELQTRKYACFIVEPIQGEGGMIVPPRDYLPEAQRLCRKYDTLLIVDEVQTGMGRTGTMFACDALGVEPDVMTLAKSLGGGLMPIGAMLVRRDLWLKAYGSIDRFALHTSTFGGGSLACTAALATLRVMRDEQVLQNCRARSEQLLGGLRRIFAEQSPYPLKEVRGQGMMIGVEFAPLKPPIVSNYKGADATGMMKYVVPNLDKAVQSVSTLYVLQTLLQVHGVYAQVARSNPLVMRIQPPLTIDAEQVDSFLGAFRSCCDEAGDMSDIVEAIISKSTMGIMESKPAAPPTTVSASSNGVH